MSKYSFIQQLDFAAFNAFSEDNGGSVYQTSYWAAVKSAWHPFYYMGYDGETPVFCALCLERKVPVGRLWYCPDGFVCDMFNAELIGEFASFIKAEMRRYGVFALVCDPLVEQRVNGTDCDTSAINAMLGAGFELNKDKSFYVVQPNVTIQTTLSGQTPETLLKKCEKGVRHGLNAAADGGLICETYDNISIEAHPEKLDDFFDVMTETSDRVSFIQRDKEYYKKIVTALGGKAIMSLIYYDAKLHREKHSASAQRSAELSAELEKTDEKNKKRISELKKELEITDSEASRYEKVREELDALYGDGFDGRVCIGAGITSRFGKTAVCLYGGTKNVLRNTLRPTHYLNWTRILKSFEDGMSRHDLGRVTGDPFDETNPLYGLCRYKRSYNGDIIEYVGDMYLIANKLRFSMFRTLLPKFKRFKNTVLKGIIKKSKV